MNGFRTWTVRLALLLALFPAAAAGSSALGGSWRALPAAPIALDGYLTGAWTGSLDRARARRLRLDPRPANVMLKGNKRSARVLRRQRKFNAKAMSVTREPAGDSQKTVLYITVRR